MSSYVGTCKNHQNPMEFMNFSSSPTSTEIQEKEKHEILISSLRIKTPSREEIKKDEDEDEEGFKTPTCLEQRIPVIPRCPPAPRKPKSTPSRKRKRAYEGGGIILDLSSEVEALFPSSTLVVDRGGKVKKVRKVN